MDNETKINSKWILITVEDRTYLPGKTIFDIICLIKKTINFQFIILDNIEGQGNFMKNP